MGQLSTTQELFERMGKAIIELAKQIDNIRMDGQYNDVERKIDRILDGEEV